MMDWLRLVNVVFFSTGSIEIFRVVSSLEILCLAVERQGFYHLGSCFYGLAGMNVIAFLSFNYNRQPSPIIFLHDR